MNRCRLGLLYACDSMFKLQYLTSNIVSLLLFTGCDVVLKNTVLSCDFDNGWLCGWTNNPARSSWVTTNTSTPGPNTGPLWGHPRGSYYAYTDTASANEEGTQG